MKRWRAIALLLAISLTMVIPQTALTAAELSEFEDNERAEISNPSSETVQQTVSDPEQTDDKGSDIIADLSDGVPIQGSLAKAGAVNRYRLILPTAKYVSLTLDGTFDGQTEASWTVTVRDADQNVLQKYAFDGSSESLETSPEKWKAGTYYIEVEQDNSGFQEDAAYSLTVVTGARWIWDANGYWYIDDDGTYPASQWKKIDGYWYHFDGNGYMQTGWLYDGGFWYYLQSNGAMATGWVALDGKWYYLSDSGAMAIGWTAVNGSWYYLLPDGSMDYSEYRDGYWLSASGAWDVRYSQGQWRQNGSGWWYQDGSWYPVNQWLWVNGSCYYFTGSGYMDYSEYRDGRWLTASGAWDKRYSNGEWKRNANGWWYEDNGWYPVNQWLWINGSCYYFDGSGYMATSTWIDGAFVAADGRYISDTLSKEYLAGVYMYNYYDQIYNVWLLVNQERARNGQPAVSLDRNLTYLACVRAVEVDQKFSHTRPDGRSCFSILDDYGIDYGFCGENIAYGATSADMVMNMWNHSEGHHKNIVFPNYSKIGIGVTYYTSWVQIFTS